MVAGSVFARQYQRYGQIDVGQLVFESDRSAVALRRLEGASSNAIVESHNLTHTPQAPWCEICVHARGTSHWHKIVSDEAKPPGGFITGTVTFCDEVSAKVTILTLVDKEIGFMGVVRVLDAFMIRYTAAFLDSVRT